jgi:uncharacterized protein (TIGR02284 family)
MDNDNTISTLNNLIETCKDGENGFRTAADGVKNMELKTLFTTYSQQRAKFAAELQGEVSGLGGDPEKTGSVVASLHRGWINIKSAVTGEDEAVVIAECESGEDSAKANYEAAMKETLPANIKSTIERQYGQVKEAHDRIRDMKKATS